MHPIDAILRYGCAAMLALYAMNFLADLERMALYAARFELALQ